MNNPFMTKRAEALAKSLQVIEGEGDRIDTAYELLYARLPDENERKVGLEYLNSPSGSWSQYAQVLLSAHEFLQLR